VAPVPSFSDPLEDQIVEPISPGTSLECAHRGGKRHEQSVPPFERDGVSGGGVVRFDQRQERRLAIWSEALARAPIGRH